MKKTDPGYVGYKAPPKKSRFKKGNTEHLKRKKHRKPDLASIAERFVEDIVRYRNGAKIKKGRRVDIYLKKMESLALKGDLQAIAALLDMREDKLQNFVKLHRNILVLDKIWERV
jgi:hypothetical protein